VIALEIFRERNVACHSVALWYREPDAIRNAIAYSKFYSRSHDAVIRVYGNAGDVIQMHKDAGGFKSRERYQCQTK
jgi:hypothetical protein